MDIVPSTNPEELHSTELDIEILKELYREYNKDYKRKKVLLAFVLSHPVYQGNQASVTDLKNKISKREEFCKFLIDVLSQHGITEAEIYTQPDYDEAVEVSTDSMIEEEHENEILN